MVGGGGHGLTLKLASDIFEPDEEKIENFPRMNGNKQEKKSLSNPKRCVQASVLRMFTSMHKEVKEPKYCTPRNFGYS